MRNCNGPISIVNTMCDTNGNKYNFKTKTWEGVDAIIQNSDHRRNAGKIDDKIS